MNPGIPDDDPSIDYYDSDYPSVQYGPYPENLDAAFQGQNIAHDVARYQAMAKAIGGPVLELCCGTGRVAIPLAADGHKVVGAELSEGQLARCRANLARVPAAAGNLELVSADVSNLDLGRRDFGLVILAFNSLVCIPDYMAQRRAIAVAARHLRPDGYLAIDVSNPLTINVNGDQTPRLMFTRRHADTGRQYSRFATLGPMSTAQVYEMTGWYDEVGDDALVRRRPYAMKLRVVHRFELQLMLEQVGLTVTRLQGGHRNEPYTTRSMIMFMEARHRAAARAEP